MSFIDTLDLSTSKPLTEGSSSGGGTPKGANPPIVNTLIENGSVMSNVESNNIKIIEVGEIKGIVYPKSENPDTRMVSEAAVSIREMLKDWTLWMEENGFKKQIVDGKECYAMVTSMYRPNTGNSMHSWGLAVDVQMFDLNGDIIANNKKIAKTGKPFNFVSNPAIKWLYQNAYKYGFVQPLWANDGFGSVDDKSADEHWHWEYHGKSAICILRKKPIPGLGNNKPSDNPINLISETLIKPFVKNPKGIDGNEAVYTSCEYKKIDQSDVKNNIITDNTPDLYPNITPTKQQLDVAKNLKGDWVERAKTLIKTFEGFIAKAKFDQNAYRGGYGSDKIVTSNSSLPQTVTKDTIFTQQTALLTLEYDVNNRFKNAVINSLGQTNWDKLNDNQKAALISYTYNTGAGTLKTRGIKANIIKSDYTSAANNILSGPIRAKKDGVLNGLIRRRKIESMVFNQKI
jgi:GH24 family phage-related lysozyme (muramidase)